MNLSLSAKELKVSAKENVNVQTFCNWRFVIRV